MIAPKTERQIRDEIAKMFHERLKTLDALQKVTAKCLKIIPYEDRWHDCDICDIVSCQSCCEGNELMERYYESSDLDRVVESLIAKGPPG